MLRLVNQQLIAICKCQPDILYIHYESVLLLVALLYHITVSSCSLWFQSWIPLSLCKNVPGCLGLVADFHSPECVCRFLDWQLEWDFSIWL